MSDLPIAGWSVKRNGEWLTDTYGYMVLVEKDKAQQVADLYPGATLVSLDAGEVFIVLTKAAGIAYDAQAYGHLKLYLMANAKVGDEKVRSASLGILEMLCEPKGEQLVTMRLGPRPNAVKVKAPPAPPLPSTPSVTMWSDWIGRGRFK